MAKTRSRITKPLLYAIGGFAGLRSAEIQRLEWSDIDLQRRFITVSALKAKLPAVELFQSATH
jgi:integrase